MTSTSSERVVVKELSSSLLDMKFMLSRKKKIEAKKAKSRDAQLEEKIRESEASSSSIAVTAEAKLEYCNDYSKLENLLFGRMSFNGFNKDVELLMEYYEKLRNGELTDDEDEGMDVNDQEMAQTMGGGKLAALSKKAQTKRERAQQQEQNQESSGGRRFNFKDIRKRYSEQNGEGEEPERKFMRPNDD
uniref:Uncharacterized protein n=1 Tax=Caenorhabditis japonica TaxID=281687 RepID=A0A8R1DRJ8_CAEJA